MEAGSTGRLPPSSITPLTPLTPPPQLLILLHANSNNIRHAVRGESDKPKKIE